MSINLQQTRELMTKAGWTAEKFAESLNSTARAEAHAAYLRTKRVPAVIPQIRVEIAAQFLATGKGIDGPEFDVLERWAERRTSYSNIVGTVFAPPMERHNLTTVTSPVILPVETELSQETMTFTNVTNERARLKMLGR